MLCSGIGGTGLRASAAIENLESHGSACAGIYDSLLMDYPEFSAKTEEALGHGLALLRQKSKFEFSAEHRFFF